MRIPALLVTIVLCLSTTVALAAAPTAEVEVQSPYLDLHSGPGAAYPVFYVVERGSKVRILKRRTDWFLVRTAKGKEGWATQQQMEQTLLAAGVPLRFDETGRGEFNVRHWEMGVLGGDFEGSDVVMLYGGYAFNANLSAELSVAQILGDFSDSILVNFNLLSQPFPRWRFSPFFTLGTGVIDTDARKTVVAAEDSTDQVGHVGVGVRTYLGQRFIFRAEYRNYVIFTSKDDNKEIDEWDLGFAFFF